MVRDTCRNRIGNSSLKEVPQYVKIRRRPHMGRMKLLENGCLTTSFRISRCLREEYSEKCFLQQTPGAAARGLLLPWHLGYAKRTVCGAMLGNWNRKLAHKINTHFLLFHFCQVIYNLDGFSEQFTTWPHKMTFLGALQWTQNSAGGRISWQW